MSYLLWALAIKIRPSGRTVCVLNHWAISPAVVFHFWRTLNIHFHSVCNSLYSQTHSFLSEPLHWIWGPPRSSKTISHFKSLNSITCRNSFQRSIWNSRGLDPGIPGAVSRAIILVHPDILPQKLPFLQRLSHPLMLHLISFLLSQSALTKSNIREKRVCLGSLFQVKVHNVVKSRWDSSS